MDLPHLLLTIFALLLMFVGLIGIAMPHIPGLYFVWVGLLLYAALTGFSVVTLGMLTTAGLAIFALYGLEFVSQRRGLRPFQATPAGIVGGVVGGFVGSLYGMLPGLTVGPTVGAILGEMLTGHDSAFVIEGPAYRYVGYLGASVLKIVIGVAIIGWWLARVF